MGPRARRGEKGFSLVELVVTLAVLGLALAVAIPGLAGARPIAIEVAAQRFAGDVRYAQRLAMTFNVECGIEVLDSGHYRVYKGPAEPAGSRTTALDPLTFQPLEVALDEDATIAGPGSVAFDARGRTGATAATFTFGGTRQVVVEAETGAVVP